MIEIYDFWRNLGVFPPGSILLSDRVCDFMGVEYIPGIYPRTNSTISKENRRTYMSQSTLEVRMKSRRCAYGVLLKSSELYF